MDGGRRAAIGMPAGGPFGRRGISKGMPDRRVAAKRDGGRAGDGGRRG